jgi:predicted nucleic acid-binding protein
VPQVVLDTNVALDWLLFADPAVAGLAARVESGALHWLASHDMRVEFADVLARPAFDRWSERRELALTSFDRLARCIDDPSARPAMPPALRCMDVDDQMFVDLAIEHRARWLFTRDKALLALAAAARQHGLGIVAPARWPSETQATE